MFVYELSGCGFESRCSATPVSYETLQTSSKDSSENIFMNLLMTQISFCLYDLLKRTSFFMVTQWQYKIYLIYLTVSITQIIQHHLSSSQMCQTKSWDLPWVKNYPVDLHLFLWEDFVYEIWRVATVLPIRSC